MSLFNGKYLADTPMFGSKHPVNSLAATKESWGLSLVPAAPLLGLKLLCQTACAPYDAGKAIYEAAQDNTVKKWANAALQSTAAVLILGAATYGAGVARTYQTIARMARENDVHDGNFIEQEITLKQLLDRSQQEGIRGIYLGDGNHRSLVKHEAIDAVLSHPMMKDGRFYGENPAPGQALPQNQGSDKLDDALKATYDNYADLIAAHHKSMKTAADNGMTPIPVDTHIGPDFNATHSMLSMLTPDNDIRPLGFVMNLPFLGNYIEAGQRDLQFRNNFMADSIRTDSAQTGKPFTFLVGNGHLQMHKDVDELVGRKDTLTIHIIPMGEKDRDQKFYQKPGTNEYVLTVYETNPLRQADLRKDGTLPLVGSSTVNLIGKHVARTLEASPSRDLQR